MIDGEVRRAYELGLAGRPQDALDVVGKVLTHRPEDADALTVASISLLGVTRHDDALHAARNAVRSDPDHEWGWRQLAHTASVCGELEEAWQASRTALRLEPGSVPGLLCVIWIDIACNDVTDVTRTAVVEAMTTDPGSIDVYLAAGAVALHDERYRSASSAYRAALQIDPNDESARRGLAQVKIDLGKTTTAMTMYLDLLIENPSSRMALFRVRHGLHTLLGRFNHLWGGMTIVAIFLLMAAQVWSEHVGVDTPFRVVAAATTVAYVAWSTWFVRRTVRHADGRMTELLRLAPRVSPPHAVYGVGQGVGLLCTVFGGAVFAALGSSEELAVPFAIVFGLPVVMCFVVWPALMIVLATSRRRARRG